MAVAAWEIAVWQKEATMNAKTGFVVTLLALIVGSEALAEEPTDYRFPRECTMTPAGYPVPLCGRPLTKTPVVIKKEGAALKKYPEHFIPEQEALATNEMRITAVGSGNPPVSSYSLEGEFPGE